MLLVILLARFWFDVPIRGSIPLLFFGASLYLMSILGVGLLISTICGTQQQALLSTFFFFQPAIMLSGFIFPIANMPTVVQWITFLDPLRYFMVIIRGIFLKGVGLSILWPEMLALAVLGVAVLWLAANRMKKNLA
jgi:ABC-2 type transport system permease protein